MIPFPAGMIPAPKKKNSQRKTTKHVGSKVYESQIEKILEMMAKMMQKDKAERMPRPLYPPKLSVTLLLR